VAERLPGGDPVPAHAGRRRPAAPTPHPAARVVTQVAQLLIPVLTADADGRFGAARARADEALALGVGGFLLYGGDTDAVRALTLVERIVARAAEESSRGFHTEA